MCPDKSKNLLQNTGIWFVALLGESEMNAALDDIQVNFVSLIGKITVVSNM